MSAPDNGKTLQAPRDTAKIVRDPRKIVEERRVSFERKTETSMEAIRHEAFDPEAIAPNIEKLVGAVHVPLGIAGPVRVHGDHARGDYFVPFATTEGTLVAGYTLGMLALTRAGGVNVKVLSEKVDLTPIFELKSLAAAYEFAQWLDDNIDTIRMDCEATTRHGQLLELRSTIIGRRVFTHFVFDAKDAMGMNMISFATHSACDALMKQRPDVIRYYLRSNLSADKKPAFSNFIHGYGKEVVAEATISRKIIQKYMNSTPEDMTDFWHASVLSGLQAGTIGHNAHIANGLAAIYIATGQDVAQIVNASQAIVSAEVTDGGDFYMALRAPCLIVATVGGGTNIDSQRECLQIMGCHGTGKSNKFAEIVAATLLAGELSIGSALANDRFIHAHKQKRSLAPN
ncbi:MAG: hydroxymethylglutaryl-CoA reductase [Candidatus Hydrogenedentes bacterium]|nr:hydroxymethylglutaryl-CoA reductase [Candidatus Hydrogenedentota bacterium]